MANKSMVIATCILTDQIGSDITINTVHNVHYNMLCIPAAYEKQICYLALYVEGVLYRSTIQISPADLDNRFLGVITQGFTHYVIKDKMD